MPSILSKYKIGKIIRLTFLVIVIVGLTDLLVLMTGSFHSVVANPFSSYFFHRWVLLSPLSSRSQTRPAHEEDPYKALFSSPEIAQYPIKLKKLVFDAKPEQVSASFEVTVSKDHPLLKKATSSGGLIYADSLASGALANISINNTALKFGPPDVVIKEGEENSQIIVKSEPVRRDGSNEFNVAINAPSFPNLLPIDNYEVVFNKKNIRVTSVYELPPLDMSADNARYLLPTGSAYAGFYLRTEESVPEQIKERTIAELLSQNLRVPVLGWVLHGVLQAASFLIFLWFLQRHRASYEMISVRTYMYQSADLIKIYLVFHTVYFAMLAINDAYATWGNPTLSVISGIQQTTALPFSYSNTSESNVLLLCIFTSVFLLPALLRRYETRIRANGTLYDRFLKMRTNKSFLMISRRRKPARLLKSVKPRQTTQDKNRRGVIVKLFLTRVWTIVAIFVFLALFTWTLLQLMMVAGIEFSDYSVRIFYSVCFSLLLLGLYLICVWLILEFFDSPRALPVLMSFVLLLLLVHSNNLLGNYLYDLIVSWGVLVLAAVILTYAFCKLTYSLLTGRTFSHYWQQSSSQKRLLICLAIITIALSFRNWEIPAMWWPLWSLGSELMDTFYLALVWLLVTILRRVSTTPYWPELPRPVRHAGVLFAVLLFFSPRQWLFWIPITTIIGYLLVDKWLLRKDGYKNVLIAEVKGKLTAIIQGVIDLNDTEKLLQTLKKEMGVKVGKGDAEYSAYTSKVSEINGVVRKKTDELMIEGHFGKDLVLAFGPTDSPWQNAKSGAFYSLLFSIPWLLVYLQSIFISPAPSDSYFILHLLNSLLLFIAIWTGYGFFFGYFYPYIRGNNGIRKGLSLYLMLLIPNLVWNALAYPTDVANWRSFLFWLLQLLIHFMLLGLIAGDFETLRRAKFRFRHLLQFYRLTSLSAWASTLVVAVGAAATTLISSGAAEMLTLALKHTGLIPPDLKLPTK